MPQGVQRRAEEDGWGRNQPAQVRSSVFTVRKEGRRGSPEAKAAWHVQAACTGVANVTLPFSHTKLPYKA